MVWIKLKIDPYPESATTCTTVRVNRHVDPDFKPKDGLPNPKGPLSQSIPTQAIALAKIHSYSITIVRIVGLPLTI